MNKINRNLLFFMAIVIFVGPFQEINARTRRETFNTEQVVPSKVDTTTYFQTVGNYFCSEQVISQMFNFTGNVAIALGMAFFYMHVQQKAVDLIGNQSLRVYAPGTIKFKLSDVAGLSSAKMDFQDIISYLEHPTMYHDIGAHMPKGILMNGAPGNGKTLLAKALAGQVNCPFISVSGSSFIQMFAGLGAARVRNVFAYAQHLAAQYGACIIFIDEIDAVARKRSSCGSGNATEHDQTVAQLLECMDGLSSQINPIIVIGATNRAELLDPAITRPGRFDRKVEITKPFIKDRIELLEKTLQNVVHADTIQVERFARLTEGFSGAKLVNLINEAAILAVNDHRNLVENKDIELALDHITLGRETQGMKQNDVDRKKTAIHEAGHAIGWLFGDSVQSVIHKASIIPRSHTLGVVWAIPLHELYESTESQMKARIIVCLCGGLAEQEFGFGKSTGVSNDLAKARAIAYDMVVKYGMSEKLNYVSYDEIDAYLPNDIATEIHKEVQKIIDECFIIAKNLITLHRNEVEMIANLLIEKGTVLGDEIYTLVGLPFPKDVESKLAL